MAAEESIYDLIPKPAPVVVKPPMHRSKFPGDAPPSCSTFGATAAAQVLTTNAGGDYVHLARVHRHVQSHALFGPKESQKPSPANFIMKQTKPELPPPKPFVYQDRRKAPLISKSDVGTLRAPEPKNYVAKNTSAAVKLKAKKPEDKTIDYLGKEDFGRPPEYLATVKGEIAQERDMVRQAMETHSAQASAGKIKHTRLPESERVQLLESLQKKHAEVNKLYQNLTHVVALDSTAKIRKKESYERELGELEHAIARLSKKAVFVEDVPQTQFE